MVGKYRMLITDQVATAPCTDRVQLCFRFLRQSRLPVLLLISLLFCTACPRNTRNVREAPNAARISDDPAVNGRLRSSIQLPAANVDDPMEIASRVKWSPIAELDLKPNESQIFTVAVAKPSTLFARALWTAQGNPILLQIKKRNVTITNGIAYVDWPHTHAYGNDFNVVVRPLPSFRHLQVGNNGDLEVEIPYQLVHHFLVMVPNARPEPGNLYFAAGRHILDCGHRPASAEIHPPYVTATIRTEPNVDPRVGPVTAAYIWVGGFFIGNPVTIELFPPPRPDPTAVIAITKPYDKEAAVGVNTSFETDRENIGSVRVNFNAPVFSNRPSEIISAWGEMFYPSWRGYQGRWMLAWLKQSQFRITTLGRDWWP